METKQKPVVGQNVIWSYDHYPYALTSKITDVESNEKVSIESFGLVYLTSKLIALPIDPTLKDRLNSLQRRYAEAKEQLKVTWEHIAIQEIPELGQLELWKKWKEENGFEEESTD